MRHPALTLFLFLLSGTALGTFELQDPAAIIQEDNSDTEEATPPQMDSGESLEHWASISVGNTECADYLLYRQQDSQWYWSRLYWLQGFISGVSHHELRSEGESRLDYSGDADSMALWIRNYCEEFPDNSLFQAADAFYDAFSE